MNQHPEPRPEPIMPSPESWLGGTDPTPGIVSVYAHSSGQAQVWQRTAQGLNHTLEHFRPFVFARSLEDLQAAGVAFAENDPAAPFSYRVLEGSSGSLRYLLEGRDFGALKAALLRGCNMRGSNTAQGGQKALSRLEDSADYYTLGLVEQYLVSTGRTYFKGLSFDALHRMQFDLETTGLDPRSSRIFMIALRDNRGFEAVLEGPDAGDEAALIAELLEKIRERDPDVLENHNLMGFDLPFLLERARRHGIALNLNRKEGPAGLREVMAGRRQVRYCTAGRELVDTLDAAKGVEAPEGRGLKALARAFGVAAPDRVYLEGSQIYNTYLEQPNRVRAYALEDVREVDALAQRLLTPFFSLAQSVPRAYGRLPYAGPAMGMLEPLLVRAYLHAGHALPGPQIPATGQHQGGGVHLFAGGMLERIVKADVASLYPSLIREHRIGPSSDPLGVFTSLVDTLTGQRLEHKRALREAKGRQKTRSRAAGEHDAAQGAMKLLINSAYGYLGAGTMALFGDQAAADRVTLEGRRTLKTVLEGLEARGVTLIEADTDGVYFSVPLEWDEARERETVAQVNALLPNKITLEFEGRYQAMLSHEIKNYALLDYDGGLKLCGASFRSSRGEMYGQRFLEAALACLLRGDVLGVSRTFRETLEGLQAGEFSNAEVSTRVRLTKTPEQYAASKRKEAAYEALLSSGRTGWNVGERVRYYKRKDGVHVALALEGESTADYDVGHYARTLVSGYAERLRKAFSTAEFEAVFRLGVQGGLFDPPLEGIRLVSARKMGWGNFTLEG